MKRLYLCGPMAGLDYSSASTWRDKVTDGLLDVCECLSPLRGEMLSNGVYSAVATDSSPFNTKSAIIGRDRADCTGVDLIFMNLLGAKTVSIGTMVELAWADASRTPVIAVMEASGNPHDSIYVRGLATYLVEDLDSGIAVARCFFNAPAKKPKKVKTPKKVRPFTGIDEKGLPIETNLPEPPWFQSRSF